MPEDFSKDNFDGSAKCSIKLSYRPPEAMHIFSLTIFFPLAAD